MSIWTKCAALLITLLKMPLPVPKTSRLLRLWNKYWWDVVLINFTDAEENFRMTRHSFMTLFNRKNGSFYVIAYAQYFPVSVFNPIKCLHAFSIGLEKSKPPLPIRRKNVFWIELNRIKLFTWFFGLIEPSVRLLTGYLVVNITNVYSVDTNWLNK